MTRWQVIAEDDSSGLDEGSGPRRSPFEVVKESFIPAPPAEGELAELVGNIRRGRCIIATDWPHAPLAVEAVIDTKEHSELVPLIDATFIYDSYRQRDEVWLYEDHPSLLPPWQECFIGYRNIHGNAVVSYVIADPWRPEFAWRTAGEEGNDLTGAAWRISIFMFASGTDTEGFHVSAIGPIAYSRIAINADGRPLDIGWVEIAEGQGSKGGDWSRFTTLGVFSFMNCRNIEIVEPNYSRAHRRREDRSGGPRSSVLTISERGRRTPGKAGPGEPIQTPMTSVAGHYRHYGDCCPGQHEPRGLLFGKYTCRIWDPQRARGVAEAGKVEQRFTVVDS